MLMLFLLLGIFTTVKSNPCENNEGWISMNGVGFKVYGPHTQFNGVRKCSSECSVFFQPNPSSQYILNELMTQTVKTHTLKTKSYYSVFHRKLNLLGLMQS